MKKTAKMLLWIVVPALFWLALVVRATPAHWAIWLADLPVQMDGVSGTAWNGRAANVVVPYPGGAWSLGSLNWQLNPWSLLSLAPCATFTTELAGQTADGKVCASLTGTVTVRNAHLTAPAGAAEIWAPVRVRGQVDAHIETLSFAGDQIKALHGSGSWSNAAYHNSQQWVKLGTIAFDLSTDGQGGIGANVFDIEGPLELNLDSQFNLTGAYAIRGNINLRPNAPEEIGQLLRIVARETARDRFGVEWVGSF